ncbi:MAG: hypothetical protein AAF466_14355 [Bacteroidota bacterium]
MKKLLFFSLFVFLFSFSGLSQTVIELGNTQSMCISGKGQGQDAAINPHINGDSIAYVENLGDNPFSIRIESKGEVVETLRVDANKKEAVKLMQGQVLYFDSKLNTSAKVDFEALQKD